MKGPDLLAFARIPLVRVLTLPTAVHVAEKLDAYTRAYGPMHAPSSRPKDLIDIVLLAQSEPFTAASLWSALEETFTTRGTHALPDDVPPPPPDWAQPYRELARQMGISTALDDGHRVAAGFLNLILRHTVGGTMRWDASALDWVRG